MSAQIRERGPARSTQIRREGTSDGGGAAALDGLGGLWMGSAGLSKVFFLSFLFFKFINRDWHV
jgi:hypothetical protein